MKQKKAKMTDKQAAFVREYLIDSNGTQAAIRAGYKENSANEQAARLLTKDSIRQAVEAGLKKKTKKCELTAEKVLKDLESLKKGAKKAKQFAAAIRASELQGKHLQMFVDKLDITGDLTVETGIRRKFDK